MRVAHLEENQRVNTAGAHGVAPGVPVPGTAPDIKHDLTQDIRPGIVAPPRRKVLVIDDSSTIRRTAEIFLAQAGYQVMLAEDGFEALAKVGELHPDLVFCDILMPRLDGYQTCSLIKKSPRFHAIPVIMLSSRDGVFDRSRGRLVGAHDHLAKPFTRDALLQAVQACLPCQPAGEALPA